MCDGVADLIVKPLKSHVILSPCSEVSRKTHYSMDEAYCLSERHEWLFRADAASKSLVLMAAVMLVLANVGAAAEAAKDLWVGLRMTQLWRKEEELIDDENVA